MSNFFNIPLTGINSSDPIEQAKAYASAANAGFGNDGIIRSMAQQEGANMTDGEWNNIFQASKQYITPKERTSGIGPGGTPYDFSPQPQANSNLGFGGGSTPAAGGNPEVLSAQNNINSSGMTEAQARAQFGNEAIDNALSKGVTFGAPATPAAATPSHSMTGSSNLGLTNPTLNQYQKNPYLDQMAQGITSQMNDNWNRNLAPSIRSGAMAVGGFGGSREGVVEANGLNDMNRSLGQNLSNLYGTDYTNSQNRNLQQYGMDQSYALGQGNLALGNKQANNAYDLGLRSSDLGFANYGLNESNSNFTNQLNYANFGLDAYKTMNANNGTAVSAGTNIQNTPLEYQKYFTNSANGTGSGYSTSTSTQNNPGNPYVSAVGGAVMGNSIQYPTKKAGY